MQTAWQRRHATRAEHILCQTSVGLKCNSQALCALLLRSNELLGSSLTDQLLLGRGGAADLEQRNSVGLGDGREPGVLSSDITLPVGVLGDVGGGKGYWIVVGSRVEAAGGRVAELRVHGDTGRALGVQREEPVDRRIDAGRLDCVLLYMPSAGRYGV